MFLVKKVGFGALYFLIGHIINSLFETIVSFYGMGYTVGGVIIVSATICWVSRTLRIEFLKKNHKGDDSPEKSIFNGDLKGKLGYIVKTKDFKLEFVLNFIAAFIAIMIPVMRFCFAIGGATVFATAAPAVMIILWTLLMPIYMTILNAFTWLSAYNRVYKRREF